MGCGKSTIGHAVSRLTGLAFFDLDKYIEQRFRHSVNELFAIHGETGFRELERNMLHELSDFENAIIACGGGTPCFYDNMQYMNFHGTTVFLDTPVKLLHSRLMRGRAKRPLIAGKSDEELELYIRESLSKRMKYYSLAQLRFTTDLLDSESEIQDSAMKFVNLLSIPLSQKE